MSFLYIIALIFLWLPVKILFPVKKLGFPKIPKKQPIIVACNHLSMRDILLMGAMFPDRQVYFLAKKELFKDRFLRMIFRGLRAIPISRGDFDFVAVKTVVGLLKKNKTVGVFPEGTRNMAGEEMLEMQNGVALFSLKTNAKIVPMYQACKPRYFRKNYVYIGKPFDFTDLQIEKLNKEKLEKATAILTEKMQHAKEQVLNYIKENNITLKPAKNKPKKIKKNKVSVVDLDNSKTDTGNVVVVSDIAEPENNIANINSDNNQLEKSVNNNAGDNT